MVALSGCARLNKPQTYTTVPNEPHTNSERAKKRNTEGLALLKKGKTDEAETAFRDALAADVDYAPAHNNLGQIYLKRHQLYLAAWEFQFAANLMPGRAESLINLGLVYETGNRLPDARAAYENALEIDPSNAIALGNLARVCVKMDDDPSRIHYLLSELVFHDSRPEWLKWAKDLLATRYQPAAWGHDTQADADARASSLSKDEVNLRAGPVPMRSGHGEVVPPPPATRDSGSGGATGGERPSRSAPDSQTPTGPIETLPDGSKPNTPVLPAPMRAVPSSFDLPVKRAAELELTQRQNLGTQVAMPTAASTLNSAILAPGNPVMSAGGLTARTVDLPATASPVSPAASAPTGDGWPMVQPAQYQTMPNLPAGVPFPPTPQ